MTHYRGSGALAVSPAGPAPTTRTSASLVCMADLLLTGRCVSPPLCREILINVNGFSKFCRMLYCGVASCPEGGSRDETVVGSRDDPPAAAGAPHQRAFAAPGPAPHPHVQTRRAPPRKPT